MPALCYRPARPRTLTALFLACCALLSGCASDRALREEATRAVLRTERGITVYAAGDIADCKHLAPQDSGAARTAALVAAGLAAEKDAVVLTLGDHTYPIGKPAEFSHCYEPTWGRFKARTYPTPGNHEYYTPHAAGYYAYFGDAAGPRRRGYYSVDVGGWHLISLNSNLKPEQHQEQLAWLQEDLERHPARCTLAFWHHPLYSSGGHGSVGRMPEAWKLLHQAGAELVLSGHDHDYERFTPQDSEGNADDARGIRQFVVGTGGVQTTPLLFRKWHSERSDNSTLGVLKLVLKQSGYEWEFLPVEKGGFSDRGATLCH